MPNYINHSGGCPGADMEWETQGNKYNVHSIAYSFWNHVQEGKNPKKLTVEELKEGANQAIIASKTLKRPWYAIKYPYVKNLLARNWFQVKNSECIFAIGKFMGNSEKIVAGGTGWAVQMAIDIQRPIFFFEQNKNAWYSFNYDDDKFNKIDYIPKLTENFAGIGTRDLNNQGKEAIKNVYINTFGE